ncbi:TetR/AcrR family transcriptional regulator [Litoribrevibacter albus]|uniref:TetR family transcriptional regulator n=1 Tax=Litoribrevibacter albus TaxID=1473156 RepID=A0AA37S6A5_9GAMM|nr:TetR/AcrR family transcriptional regulator [Litoribrevibacter albus]GLQ29895.1 TetR family transcriptional regulator [Litoribrevibacter albus]
MTIDTSKVQSRKEREFQRREQEILEAANELFEKDTWEDVTVSQIAEQAGIGKGTVYKHFSCKEDIYARVALSFHYQLMEVFQSIDQEQGVLGFMREAISESFRFYRENNVCAKLSSYCKRIDFKKRISPHLREEYEALDVEFETFFGGLLESGIAEGVIKNQPIMHLMIGLEATFEGAISMMMNDSYTDFSELKEDEFVEVITGFMMNALAASSEK